MDTDGCKISGIWVGIIIGIIVLGIIGTIASLVIQREYINPQVRQNMTLDPAKTIADRSDFHSKLSEIISADQNIIVNIDQVQRCEAQTPVCSNDDTLQNNLAGVEQIRNTAINAYDAKAGNPDDNKYLESWMPKKIDATIIPDDYDSAKTMLQQEINNLQGIYNKGV